MQVRFSGRSLEARPGETVLECLERHGLSLPSSCRSGVCQSCLLKAVSGVVPAAATAGLTPLWRQRGYLLACICRPEGDLELAPCDAARSFETRITRVSKLSTDVCGVWLERPAELAIEAGQFIHLTREEDGLTRPYSVASPTSSDELELHVALVRQGRMSSWLSRSAGARVSIRGPFGDCCYQSPTPDEPLLFVGTGTGLAPLLGVVQTALARGHRGPIRLYHGARPEGSYRASLLRELAQRHTNFQAVICVREQPAVPSEPPPRVGRLEDIVFSDFPKLAEFRVYLCGNPDLVRGMKRRAYLAGASLSRIHADPFVHASPPQTRHPEAATLTE